MDFVEIISILEASDLVRGCVLFKSSNNMQKTINYINSNPFTINLNGSTFNNINQLFFIIENTLLYIYLEELLDNNNAKYSYFPLQEINSLEVVI